jgi:hypothetical protein
MDQDYSATLMRSKVAVLLPLFPKGFLDIAFTNYKNKTRSLYIHVAFELYGRQLAETRDCETKNSCRLEDEL